MKNAEYALDLIRQTLNLSNLEFNVDGNAEIIFDDVFSVYLTKIDMENIELSFYLPDIDINNSETLVRMLTANCLGVATRSGRLAIDPEENQAIYCERWRTTDFDFNRVDVRLKELIEIAKFWSAEAGNFLSDYNQDIENILSQDVIQV